METTVPKKSTLDADVLAHNQKLYKTLEPRHTQAKMGRQALDADLPQIYRYIKPNSSHPGVEASYRSVQNRIKNDKMFDSTAMEACIDFAAQMTSYMTNPVENWAEVGRNDITATELLSRPDTAKALAKINEIIFQTFRHPRSGFSTAAHEFYWSMGAVGNGTIVGHKDTKRKLPVYQAIPFENTYFTVDEYGFVDSVSYEWRYNKDQYLKLSESMPGGFICLPDAVLNSTDVNEYFTVVKTVYPRTEYQAVYDKAGLVLAHKKPVAVVLWMPNEQTVIYEGGYDRNCHFAGRLFVFPGDVYGTGSGQLALPITLYLQKMLKDFALAGSLSLSPTMWLEDESIVSPSEGQLVPGQFLKGVPNAPKPEPIYNPGRLDYTDWLLNNMKASVRKLFWIDDFIRDKKKERQTLGEVVDDRDEMLKGLSPVFGRGSTECFYNLLKWHYNTLIELGRIPKELVAQAGITEENFDVLFIGPLAKAHKAQETKDLQLFLQDVAQLRAQFEDAADGVKIPQIVQKFASNRSVGHYAMNDEAEIARKQKAREDGNNAMAQAQAAEQATSAMKNVADAQSKMF